MEKLYIFNYTLFSVTYFYLNSFLFSMNALPWRLQPVSALTPSLKMILSSHICNIDISSTSKLVYLTICLIFQVNV